MSTMSARWRTSSMVSGWMRGLAMVGLGGNYLGIVDLYWVGGG
ncbi:MAG: hypothetical protein AAFS04_12995 [Cyanobacteria bacterium J06631_9]